MTDILAIVLLMGSGFGFGVLATLAYIGSLGWERDGVYSINEDTPV